MAVNALVMIVDDDAQLRELVRTLLTREGHDVVEAGSAEEAIQRLDRELPDLLIADLQLPKGNGMDLIEQARKRDPTLPAIMLSGHGSLDRAVEAMKKGASDFIAKPFDFLRLTSAVKKALEGQMLRREVLLLRSEQCQRLGEIGSVMIGSSPAMTTVYRTIKQVAKSPVTTVLIQGESGTGKELIAKAIHLSSDRKEKRFVDINCAALTESLLEAELFGYEKGAFTGAAGSGKPGLFEAADGGTIFLDEIGEMSLPLQAKLLRVLQERKFKRVGGVEDVEVDIRIIASTNRDLESLVKESKFRLDLYYRLRVVPIPVPPLRERKEDVLPIALHYVEAFSAQLARPVLAVTPEARAELERHDWPGNVRELRNVIERAIVLSTGDRIGVESLLFGGGPPASAPEAEELGAANCSIAEMEKRLIRNVLRGTSWRRAEAAKILGINRTTLYNKIREYALAPDHGKEG